MFQSFTHIIYLHESKLFYCWYCKYIRYKYMYMLSTNAIITNCDISVHVSWVTEPKNKNSKKKNLNHCWCLFWLLPFLNIQKLNFLLCVCNFSIFNSYQSLISNFFPDPILKIISNKNNTRYLVNCCLCLAFIVLTTSCAIPEIFFQEGSEVFVFAGGGGGSMHICDNLAMQF